MAALLFHVNRWGPYKCKLYSACQTERAMCHEGFTAHMTHSFCPGDTTFSVSPLQYGDVGVISVWWSLLKGWGGGVWLNSEVRSCARFNQSGGGCLTEGGHNRIGEGGGNHYLC